MIRQKTISIGLWLVERGTASWVLWDWQYAVILSAPPHYYIQWLYVLLSVFSCIVLSMLKGNVGTHAATCDCFVQYFLLYEENLPSQHNIHVMSAIKLLDIKFTCIHACLLENFTIWVWEIFYNSCNKICVVLSEGFVGSPQRHAISTTLNVGKGGGTLGSDATLVGVSINVWYRTIHVGAGLAPW